MQLLSVALDWFSAGACPSCPTNIAARDAFFSEDVGTRLGGMLGPFIVTLGLMKLVLDKLGAGSRGRGRDKGGSS